MRVFSHTFLGVFFHKFVYVFVCVFLSYICKRVFFIHFYICIWVGRGAVVSVVVQEPESWRFNPHSLLNKRIGGQTVGGVAVHLLVTAEVRLNKASPGRCNWLPTTPLYEYIFFLHFYACFYSYIFRRFFHQFV